MLHEIYTINKKYQLSTSHHQTHFNTPETMKKQRQSIFTATRRRMLAFTLPTNVFIPFSPDQAYLTFQSDNIKDVYSKIVLTSSALTNRLVRFVQTCLKK